MERFDYIQDLLYELYEEDNESDIESVFIHDLEEYSDIESIYTNEDNEDITFQEDITCEENEDITCEEKINTNYFEYYFNKYKEKYQNKLNENKIELEFKYKLINDINKELSQPISIKQLKPNYNGKSKFY